MFLKYSLFYPLTKVNYSHTAPQPENVMEGTVHCKHATIIHEPRLRVGGVILWQTTLNLADYTADPELNISTTL